MVENLNELITKANNKISVLERQLIIDKSNNDNLKEEISKLEEEIEEHQSNLVLGVESVNFIEKTANHERSLIKDKVESVITDALKEIYGNEYSITFDYTMKRNKTSVDIYLTKHTKLGDIVRKQGGFGGGVSDVISLPLKLLVLLALKNNDKILIADEPGKHMDERVDKFGFFLKNVCDKLGIQLIILTHHESLAEFGDAVYKVSMIDKITTKVERIN